MKKLLICFVFASLIARADSALPPEGEGALPEIACETPQAFGKDLEDPRQLFMLERFLDMSPERLAGMRETIERIEAMSPEERALMRERLAQYRQLHEAERQRFMEAFRRLPAHQQCRLRDYWQNLSPEQRQQQRQQLRQMSPEERQQWRSSVLKKTEGTP